MARRERVPRAAPDDEPPPPPPEIPEWLETVRIRVENEAPILRTLLVRAINAVLRFTDLSEGSIQNASAAPTDMAVLVRALASGELLDDLRTAEPLAPAFIRGILASRRLIEEHGGVLSSAEVAEILGVSRQAVEKRRRAGKLLAVSTGRHGFRYPAWQFDEAGILYGLEDVLKTLAPHDEWMQAAFFVSRNGRLADRTPVEALKSGEVNAVIDAAVVYGEHGAE